MIDLSTSYMGLRLDNPIVVSSSSLTGTLDGVKRAAEAGAGAVVLKSLFEEQIEADIEATEDEPSSAIHPEAAEYVRQMGKHLGPQEYLRLIEKSRAAAGVPIIASLNCVSGKWWGSYARQIKQAGAHGLELNIALMPRSGDQTGEEIEHRIVRIVDMVRREVDLPIGVKIGPYFTNLVRTVRELRRAGAGAVVLFNRFYQLDIDLEKISLSAGYQFSSPHEASTTLRWISILNSAAGCDLAASTGVHDADGAAKMLLAGASAVQICSTLFINGLGRIEHIKRGLSEWMTARGFSGLGEFRGRLSMSASEHPELYERLQYIKALTGIS